MSLSLFLVIRQSLILKYVLRMKQADLWFDHVTPEQHIGVFSNLASLSAGRHHQSVFYKTVIHHC